MKLKQKFESWFLKEVRFTISKTHIADRFEEIADNHAIEFAEWLTNEKSKYSIMYGNQEKRFSNFEEDYTPKELLQIYKKEKKL
jgi:hypothetical protein